MRLFFFGLENGIELDGRESVLKQEQEGALFLETFVNESIKNCRMSVADFERIVHIHYGAKIHWNEKDNSGVVAGEVEVTKKDSCIDEIRFTGNKIDQGADGTTQERIVQFLKFDTTREEERLTAENFDAM
jgi:hypothetical protein